MPCVQRGRGNPSTGLAGAAVWRSGINLDGTISLLGMAARLIWFGLPGGAEASLQRPARLTSTTASRIRDEFGHDAVNVDELGSCGVEDQHVAVVAAAVPV